MNDAVAINVTAAAERLPIGIHFGVPDEVYFVQDALGSTDRKQLAIDPVEWQFDRLHGEDTNTKAKIWGSALHSRVLEGVDAYRSRFGVLTAKDEIVGLLDTVADLKRWLDAEGAGYKASAPKPDLIRLVKSIDPEAPIWEEIKSVFDATFPEDRRLTADMAAGIEVAAQWLQASEKLAPFMEGGTFKFGSPELTIIYEIDGVRLRARFDYVLPGVLVDLKTYRPWRNTGEPTKAIVQAIGNFRYDLQAAAYFEAFAAAEQLWRSGAVFGAEPYPDFLKMVFERPEPPTWLWIMIKGDGAPRPRIVEFPRHLTVFKTAEIMIVNALRNFREMRDRFGLTADWQSDDPVVVLENEDFPAWFGIN